MERECFPLLFEIGKLQCNASELILLIQECINNARIKMTAPFLLYNLYSLKMRHWWLINWLAAKSIIDILGFTMTIFESLKILVSITRFSEFTY